MLSNKIINQCLEWLYNQESPVIFTSKDFEKKYKKVKSLNSSQSKEILDYLIQEDHLNLIKCGTINVYYIYINDKYEFNTKQWYTLLEKNVSQKHLLIEKRKEYEKLLRDKQEHEQEQKNIISRDDLLKKYKILTNGLSLKERELNKLNQLSKRWDSNFIQNSLNNIETMKEDLINLKENIDILIEYLSKTYNVNEDEIKKEFDIPEEFTVFI